MNHLSKFLCSATIASLLSLGCQKENNMDPAGGKATSAGNQERTTVNGRGQSPPGRVVYTGTTKNGASSYTKKYREGTRGSLIPINERSYPFTVKKYDDGSEVTRIGDAPYPDYDPKTIMNNGGTLDKVYDGYVYTSADKLGQGFFPLSKFGNIPPHLNNNLYLNGTVGGGHSRQSPSDHVSRSQSTSTRNRQNSGSQSPPFDQFYDRNSSPHGTGSRQSILD